MEIWDSAEKWATEGEGGDLQPVKNILLDKNFSPFKLIGAVPGFVTWFNIKVYDFLAPGVGNIVDKVKDIDSKLAVKGMQSAIRRYRKTGDVAYLFADSNIWLLNREIKLPFSEFEPPELPESPLQPKNIWYLSLKKIAEKNHSSYRELVEEVKELATRWLTLIHKHAGFKSFSTEDDNINQRIMYNTVMRLLEIIKAIRENDNYEPAESQNVLIPYDSFEVPSGFIEEVQNKVNDHEKRKLEISLSEEQLTELKGKLGISVDTTIVDTNREGRPQLSEALFGWLCEKWSELGLNEYGKIHDFYDSNDKTLKWEMIRKKPDEARDVMAIVKYLIFNKVIPRLKSSNLSPQVQNFLKEIEEKQNGYEKVVNLLSNQKVDKVPVKEEAESLEGLPYLYGVLRDYEWLAQQAFKEENDQIIAKTPDEIKKEIEGKNADVIANHLGEIAAKLTNVYSAILKIGHEFPKYQSKTEGEFEHIMKNLIQVYRELMKAKLSEIKIGDKQPFDDDMFLTEMFGPRDADDGSTWLNIDVDQPQRKNKAIFEKLLNKLKECNIKDLKGASPKLFLGLLKAIPGIGGEEGIPLAENEYSKYESYINAYKKTKDKLNDNDDNNNDIRQLEQKIRRIFKDLFNDDIRQPDEKRVLVILLLSENQGKFSESEIEEFFPPKKAIQKLNERKGDNNNAN